jgi:hypothetical protein
MYPVTYPCHSGKSSGGQQILFCEKSVLDVSN